MTGAWQALRRRHADDEWPARAPGQPWLALLLILAGTATTAATQQAPRCGSPAPLVDDQGFVLAVPGRPIELPADHGSHPETRIEWWYLTGPLRGPHGELFGFQATWFRRALVLAVDEQRSPLATRDVILFHGALTDVDGGTMLFTESACRAYPPWAQASPDRLAVQLFEQRLEDDNGSGVSATLAIDLGEAQLQLELDLAASDAMLHGEEPGLSVKGTAPGQASWYYSLPTVAVQGQLRRPGQPALPLQGRAWLDHEFGSGPLASHLVGWDWFATVLDDGTELMAYQLRRDDGSPAPSSSISLRLPGGPVQHISWDGFRITASETWISPHSDAVYPSHWLLQVFQPAIELRIRPAVADQELITAATGVTYWEGLCGFEGQRDGHPVQGQGYVELVGYAGSVRDRFSSRPPPAQQDTKR